MTGLLNDLRYALRQLRKNPGFTFTAVVILALGIAASTAIFAFVDAALIKPLPYGDSARLVDVTGVTPMFPRDNLSYPDYLDWKKLNQVFSDFDVYNNSGYLLRTPSGADPVPAVRVSANFFRTLGLAPILGRDFHASEDQVQAPQVTILSHAAWQKRFGGSRNVIGQTVSLDGVAYTVIGVLPDSFQFAPQGDAEFWTTFRQDDQCSKSRGCHNVYGVARLKGGITVATALANVKAIARQLEMQYPDTNRDQGAAVAPLADAFVAQVRPLLLALLGGAGLLLLIASVNVSSLLLVRSESRKREIAVRGALGVSRGRLVRQFATEGFALAVLGGASGVALAQGTMRLLSSLISKDVVAYVPFFVGLGLNSHVVAFAAAITLGTAILLSLTPIVRLSLGHLRDGLTESGRGSTGTYWLRFGSHLVAIELAVAVVLLVGAGLLSKSLYRLLHVQVGFDPTHLATVTVAISPAAYPKEAQQAALGHELTSRLASLPGVQSVGVTTLLPVSYNGNTLWIRVVGHPYNGEHNEVNERSVSSEFFNTIHAKLLHGRYFTENDDSSKPRVVIINQSLARKYFPGEDPLGRKIGNIDLSPASLCEIVGVIDDVRDGSLDAEIWPAIYYPFSQSPDTYFHVVARTAQNEASLLSTMVATIRQVDSGIGITNEMTMATKINQSPSAYIHRSASWLVGGFAALALVLGVVGLYGVIAYSVERRTREIGVRMALGAQRRSVYQLILREAAWLTAGGILAGLICSVGVATLIRGILFGVQSWDIGTLASVSILLASAALLAACIPAYRAARLDPMVALRCE